MDFLCFLLLSLVRILDLVFVFFVELLVELVSSVNVGAVEDGWVFEASSYQFVCCFGNDGIEHDGAYYG